MWEPIDLFIRGLRAASISNLDLLGNNANTHLGRQLNICLHACNALPVLHVKQKGKAVITGFNLFILPLI